MQAGHAHAISLHGVGNDVHSEPGSHCLLHTMRYRETCSTNYNFLTDSLRNGDAAKKVAQQLKIAERGQIHERAAVRDDQGLPDLASPFEFIDGFGVRRPILRGVDDVGDAAPL
jgi:hypothetical protein